MKKRLRIKTYIAALTLMAATSAWADPPTPPAGKVWILNHEMSDEFDANSPDISKWNVFDKGNSWDRSAAFDKRIHEAVKAPGSDNYYLSMNPMWYYEDERFTSSGGRTYNFAGGGMDTRAMQTYGYFEVRVKPSDFPMGSGVFMNSRGTTNGSCNEKYATELDIIENMGYTGPFNAYGDGSFNNIQHVNSHAKPYSDASGTCQPLPYESENSGVQGKPLAEPLGFNTVGLWWKDEQTAAYYNNDTYFGTITPRRNFNLPMPVIIVMESYGWGSDEKNATNPKPVEYMFEDDFRTKEQRAVMYDWVRVWKLQDIDPTKLNDQVDRVQVLNPTQTTYPTNKPSATVLYSSSADRMVVATLYNASSKELAKRSYAVSKGVRSIFTEFKLDSDIPVSDNYKIVYDIKDGEEIHSSDTTVINVVSRPLQKQLWREGIPSSLPPGKNSYNIDVKYETDANSTVVIEIRRPDGSWFGGGSKNVSAGNGVATVNVKTSANTTVAANYFYKIYMHRQGMDWRDPLLVSISPTLYFNVEKPIVPAIKITSAPAEIQSDAAKVDVEFQYATTENGTLNIQLINSEQEVVALERRTERIGTRTLTRTIKIDSILSPSSDYKIAITFSPNNGTFKSITDTLHHVSVIGNSTAILPIAQNKLSVYPSLAYDKLYVEFQEKIKEPSLIEVSTVNGKTMYRKHLVPGGAIHPINIWAYAKGVYILNVTCNGQHYSAKFIKQ